METIVNPHILRRPLGDDNEAVVTVPTGPGRALLVLRDATAAQVFGERAGMEDFEAHPVAPAEISEVCARHDLALVALYGVMEPEDVSVFSPEVVSEIFGDPA
jgi:hypothetical protein